MATRGTGLARRGNDLAINDPWTEIQDMRRTVDDLFSRFFGYTPMSRLVGNAPASWGWEPNADLWETEDEIVLRADLPGFNREDINLDVTADSIQISAQHREETSEEPSGSSEIRAEGKNGEKSGKSAKSGDGASASTAVQTAQPQHPRTYHLQGRQRRSFSVSYALPKEIDPNKVNASFKDGVLEVHMAKPEQSRPKHVQVEVQG